MANKKYKIEFSGKTGNSVEEWKTMSSEKGIITHKAEWKIIEAFIRYASIGGNTMNTEFISWKNRNEEGLIDAFLNNNDSAFLDFCKEEYRARGGKQWK